MREIKFRAWVTSGVDKDIMIYQELPDADGRVSLRWNDNGTKKLYFCLTEVLCSPGYIPLQYTGLKDNYGNDIYEGDILRWTHTNANSLFGEVVSVVWDRNRFTVPYDDGELWEVIGNIYENPELLEEHGEEI